MVVGNQDTGGANNGAHPSGIPQDQIDNIMRGIANTGDVKMNNHRKKLRQRFDIIKKLGQGTYGKVQLGINKETGQEVAIKTIKKCKIEAEADLVRIRREVQIMSSVQHPNIIHIYEVFENREKMVLVMEFAAGGELYDYLSERKVLNEEEARRIFRQVATAVYYCHKHKICHRDLKLENILLDEHGNAKIADFGLSNVFDEQCLLATFCGSPLYASPEIVEGTPYHGPEVDCWSLGVLLYTLVYGSMPFDGSNFKRLVKQISQGDYYEPKKPSRASSLIREMLTVCPRKRATIEQICSHWWVNETDNVSCLELAEDLANQTPVRLDVLLSLTPVAVTADQLVVPSADGGNSAVKSVISRSHSVGSIRDVVPNTEAERRILDMVAAGGEAALMPSPTRTITPAQSPLQTKRKLENTISTDNAIGVALKKKDKTEDNATNLLTEESVPAVATGQVSRAPTVVETKAIPMETEDSCTMKGNESRNFSAKDMEMVDDLCEQLIQDRSMIETAQQSESIKEDSEQLEDSPEKSKGASKVIKKFVNKHKTADLVNFIGKVDPHQATLIKSQISPENVTSITTGAGPKFVRKCSLQDESPLSKFNAERRKSRILETAEKFQQMNASNVNAADKNKKLIIPGVSVGNFKKEYERKASSSTENQGQQLTAGERRALEQVAAAAAIAAATEENEKTQNDVGDENAVETSDSKASVSSFSLEEARRSMENSIALLRQAQTESSKDVNQLCAKTESIHFGDSSNSKPTNERERKLINARAIIGNAIQPVSPQPGEATSSGGMKTSTASITLKSATLPRRKTAKTEIQLDIKPPIAEQPSMRFTTEMQHPVADLRSAPPREGPIPYSPIKAMASQRASSLEPKEHVIPVQRPPSTYTRTISNSTTRSGSLSRQSTNDSESDTTTNLSQATITGSSQPIKKSPREFIIPIAVEGGGFITPREGSIEPSESSQTSVTTSSRSTFGRLRPTRRIGSLLSESGVDEGSPFQKLRTSTSIRDGDDDSRFTLHKLRSSRPVKKLSQENDSQSSGEEDDDDGFEILTAENLFSTLLQRVRALTNRMNVNNDISTAFPSSSRLLSNMRQAQSPFWNQESFGSRLNSAEMSAPWRHSMSRDMGSDMDSMFSRTGATLPRGHNYSELKSSIRTKSVTGAVEEPLDLADLDLSRLRLSKKDLETLSNIAPGLPKCFQEQLLEKLPPTQARKLSRTLSVQTNQNCSPVQVYKRSQSSGRSVASQNESAMKDEARDQFTKNLIKTTLEENVDDASREKAPVKVCYSKNKSVNKSSEENCKDVKPLQNSDINDKYKYYSPYVNKTVKDSFQKSTSKVPPSESAPSGSTPRRPPSGRISPPPAADLTTKRPVQRRVSRLIRPDFLDIHIEEMPVDQSQTLSPTKTENVAIEPVLKPNSSRHIRNKSVELSVRCDESSSANFEAPKYNRRSLSRSRDLDEKGKVDKSKLADKILQELQILSSMRSQELDMQEKQTNENISAEKPASSVKKIKKVKNKEKSTESSTDGDLKNSNTLVKKVKKIVKKSETSTTTTTKKVSNEFAESIQDKSAGVCDISSPKKVSKLKRPKSYPMKDSVSASNTSEMCVATSGETNDISKIELLAVPSTLGQTDSNNTAGLTSRESRILRPKSYPSSKLVGPKESKQIGSTAESLSTMSGQKSDLPSASAAKLNKNPPSSSQIPDTVSSDIKKVVKVTKKQKLSKLGSASTIATSTPNASSSPGQETEGPSLVPSIPLKEKVTQKKPNKGLLYAIGQKFEKLRASATSTSCANIPSNKKASLDTMSSENLVKKASEIKKTKSLCENPNENLTHLEKKNTKVLNRGRSSAENDGAVAENEPKPTKNEKRSRIDAMIRNIRERSIPRSHRTISSESNYIKRAVSVEEMPGTFNKKSVNKVLGLFKRYEKDASSEHRVRSARSASNIQTEVSDQSPIYQNAHMLHELNKEVEKCNSSGVINVINKATSNPVKLCKQTNGPSAAAHQTCPGCFTSAESSQDRRKGLMLELIKPEKLQHSTKTFTNSRLSRKYPFYNDNEIYSNISPHNKYIYNHPCGNSAKIATADNISNNNISSLIQKSVSGCCNNNNNNNNSNSNNHCSSLHTSQTSGYRTSSTHEMTQNNNLLSPSFENIGNYSSDSRSFQEDCASNSTFLSPTEEAELCFDSWSVCSEENYRGQRTTPSPTVSHLSRASQASSPTRRGDISEAGESVVDRIKRRSFYCRFNEKKPKRTSSIVGPNAVREYYRDKSSSSKTRSSKKPATDFTGDREHSPDITQEFFRPLKLSPIGTELKPPVYRSSFSSAHDYSAASGRPRKSLNDIRTPSSPSCLSERRHTTFSTADNELFNNTSVFPSRYKPNTYDETPKTTSTASNLYSYSTYNPRRRFSFTTNSGVSTATNNGPQIDGYATLGRRPIRSYDHRTVSLLDSPHPNTYRHESATPASGRDYAASLSRSNSRYRKSSTPRSPTNI